MQYQPGFDLEGVDPMLTRRFGALAILALTIACGANFTAPSPVYGSPLEGPATMTADFAAPSILVGQAVALRVYVVNPATNPSALTGVGFTITLPAGLTVSNGTANVCNGTLARTAPSGVVLTGATMAVGATCEFDMMTTGAAAGTHTVTIGGATSVEGGTGTGATASIDVNAVATIAAVFTPSSVAPGATTQLHFTITDPAGNPDDLKFFGLTDTLPAGLTVASAGPTETCVGVLTLTAPSTISLSAATIPMAAPCQFSVTVTAAAAGSYTDTATGTLGGSTFVGNTATATLAVGTATAPPTSTSDAGTNGGTPAPMPLLLMAIAGLAAAGLTLRLAARSRR
jgi:hypothetical protein